MVNWNVQPRNDINGIKFGMTRETVRKILSIGVKEFKKSKYSKMTTDDFGICHVFYNAHDECEAVEIFDDVTVTVNGKIVFPKEISAAKEIFPDLEEENDSYISKSGSVGIYAPNGKMESILFGAEKYY